MSQRARIGQLTVKQEAFAQGLASGFSALHSAESAGYSKTTARSISVPLSKDPRVLARVATLKAESALFATPAANEEVSQKWVERRLVLIIDEAMDKDNEERDLALAQKTLMALAQLRGFIAPSRSEVQKVDITRQQMDKLLDALKAGSTPRAIDAALPALPEPENDTEV